MLPFDSQIRGTSNALLIAGRNAASRQEATVVISEIHSQSGNEYTHRQPVVAAFPESYLLAPRCRVLLEQLTGLQLVKKYHAFHGTRRFITAITRVRHLSLSWASPIQSIYPHPNSWRSILILSTHLRLGLPSGLFPSGFPSKTQYTPISSPIRATCPAHLILLDQLALRVDIRLLERRKKIHKYTYVVYKHTHNINVNVTARCFPWKHPPPPSPRRSKWGRSLPPDCLVSRASIPSVNVS